jgi:hypothetical protein|tara:strand:- start:18 stop:338 length:321 start_codon:yes stop_codon:yes gene_type:complete
MTKEDLKAWKPKLDEKIKALNSSRVFKKITPKYDLSWYIKWVSSVFIIIAMALTSANVFPLNIVFHLLGVTGWLAVGLLWHDRALIFLNGVAIFVFLSGILNHYYG